MVNVTSLLANAGSGVGFSFGVRAWTEMKIRCVKGMYSKKLNSSVVNCELLSVKIWSGVPYLENRSQNVDCLYSSC